MNRLASYRIAAIALTVALLLRAAIPVVYMPSASDDGLLFAMCPSAVPADILVAMAGAGQAAHDHDKHHAGHQGGANDAEASSSHFDTGHCPIGQVLSAAFVTSEQPVIAVRPSRVSTGVVTHAILRSVAPTQHRSRGPPA